MDIADISQSATVKTARRASAIGTAAAAKVQPEAPAVDNSIRALDALRAELRASLRVRFSAGFGEAVPAFAPFSAPASAGDVAGEALNAARQVADAAPGRAPKSLVAFKSAVSETVESVRETFRGRRDVSDVDAVGRFINQGIDGLARERAGDVESATRVLEVDSRVSQRSAIRIRTQEGDLVTIRLRNVERFSASDAAVSDADGEATRTSVEASQSRSASFRIEGDLNDAERAAISEVVSQATAIADEFFGGDLSEAFANASAFEFDASQLQRVNLRFRAVEQRSVRYAEEIVRAPEPQQPAAPAGPDLPPAAPGTGLEPVINRPALVAAPKPAEPAARVDPVEPAAAAETQPAKREDAPVDAAEPGAPVPVVDTGALNRFFSFVADFLRESSVAFESAGEPGRFFFSESFKLTLLRETLVTTAPEARVDAAETAAGVIDKLLEVDAVAAEADDD